MNDKWNGVYCCPVNLAATLRAAFNGGRTLEDIRRELKPVAGLDIEEMNLVLVMQEKGQAAKFLKLDWKTLMSVPGSSGKSSF